MSASARVQKVWAQRTHAEYRSAAVSTQLLHRLMVIGLSADALTTCHRIIADELEHARLSAEVLAAAGAPAAPPIDHRSLSLPGQGSPEASVLWTCGRVFCCGETVAVPLFRALREEAVVPEAVRALDRILADEAVHRAFGWELLDELLERYGEGARQQARAWLPEWVAAIERGYPRGSTRISGEDRRWGLMASDRYGAIREACVRDTILPWFSRRGVAVAT